MTVSDDPAREDLARWADHEPTDWLGCHPALARHLALRAGDAFEPGWLDALGELGRVVPTTIEPAVALAESHRGLPRHVPFDGIGRRVERVEFHPAQDAAARAAWSAGLADTDSDRAGDLRLAAGFFLATHVGEGGLACPLVCTVGLRRALEHRAPEALRARYVPGLRGRDGRATRGAQLLTEVQGGSDVGANRTVARPDPQADGAWRLTGEKWFCSVADADLFAVTARPEGAPPGTRGLGCFLVPRHLEDGSLNGFTVRRLKDKLGTRGLASAEIEFAGARAYPLGPVDQGFEVAVEELLNVSRWLNAVGSAGIMGRAWLVAATYAAERRAFGRPIVAFDGVREQVALLRAECDAALASTLALSDLVGRLDEGIASDDERDAHRFLVNALKFVTSRAATDAVHDAIEVLGGNGTIEDFSALPRLYRDAIVFESWEGTHHVLCAQVQRDCARLDLAAGLRRWLVGELERAPAGDLAAGIARAGEGALALLAPGVVEGLSGADARRAVERVTRVVQAATLARAADDEPAAASTALFVARHLGAEGLTRDWSGLVEAVVASSGP